MLDRTLLGRAKCVFMERCCVLCEVPHLPDSQQLATTSADKTIKLWNLETFMLDRALLGRAK